MYQEKISLSSESFNIQRTVYDLFEAFGDVGGIMFVFNELAKFIVVPLKLLEFKIIAILKLFKIKKNGGTYKKPGIIHKIRMLTCLC